MILPSCIVCGAVLEEDDIDKHREWHLDTGLELKAAREDISVLIKRIDNLAAVLKGRGL